MGNLNDHGELRHNMAPYGLFRSVKAGRLFSRSSSARDVSLRAWSQSKKPIARFSALFFSYRSVRCHPPLRISKRSYSVRAALTQKLFRPSKAETSVQALIFGEGVSSRAR